MSTRPSPAYKKATDSFYQLWGNLKSNMTQQSQLKAAVYNFVIIAVVASSVAVCLVFGPFLKPLLWALLVGAVLFPFKYSLSSALKSWFQRLEDDDTHLLVGIALAPLDALESLGEYLWSAFIRHMQLLISGAVGLLFLRLFLAYAPKGIFCAIWRYIRWSHTLCTNVLGSLDYKIVSTKSRIANQLNDMANKLYLILQVIAVLLIYVTCVVLFWKHEKSLYFMLIGQSLYVVLVAYVCSFLGALQVPVLIAVLTYAFAGFLYNLKGDEYANDSINGENNQTILERCASFWDSPAVNSTPNRDGPIGPSSVEDVSISSDPIVKEEELNAVGKPKLELNLKASDAGNLHGVHFVNENNGRKSQSAIYFKVLFLACVITILYKQLLVLLLTFIPIIIYLLNKIIVIFGIKDYAIAKIEEIGALLQVSE